MFRGYCIGVLYCTLYFVSIKNKNGDAPCIPESRIINQDQNKKKKKK